MQREVGCFQPSDLVFAHVTFEIPCRRLPPKPLDDLTSTQIQTWYGIKDTGASISGRSSLIQRDILAESQMGAFGVRVVKEGAVGDLTTANGWFMDLVSPVNGIEGERIVVPNRFQGQLLIGTTRIPEAGDVCRPGGRGFVKIGLDDGTTETIRTQGSAVETSRISWR